MRSPFDGLEVEEAFRPTQRSFGFDLDACLSSVVVLEAKIPGDAYTAGILGTERLGNGIVIGTSGLVLTIGYLITEADDVTLITGDGRRIPAHVLGVDQSTGLGLVHALDPLDLPALPIGDSRRIESGDTVISAGGGGRAHALSGKLVAHAPFAGYWEFQLNDALYVQPAHPHWSGAALIGASGELIGVGSLQMEHEAEDGRARPLNMFIPAELLPPVLDDLASGRPVGTPRPWLGVFSQEVDDQVVVLDVSGDSPAARAELRRGDIIRAVNGKRVKDLAGFYTRLWGVGEAGAVIPLTLQRGGDVFDVEIRSADRAAKLKKRRLN